jgi:hypothetical protein
MHHLADAQVNWYIRPKVAVTEDQPVTKTYEEKLWAELDDARHGPIEPSLRMFEGVTGRWCRFLESLQPADWCRKFANPEMGQSDGWRRGKRHGLAHAPSHCAHHRAAQEDGL